MSTIFPTFDELYKAIINDCYKILSVQQNGKDKSLTDNQINIIYKINALKSNIIDNKSKNDKYSDIISFTSIYINNLSIFFSKNEIDDIYVEYADVYCLAYIALVGFKFNLINNLQNDEIFSFKFTNYENFSNILLKHQISEEHLNLIRSKSNNNIYLNFIKEFDPENQFYPKLINGKNNLDNTDGTNLTTIGDNSKNKIKYY